MTHQLKHSYTLEVCYEVSLKRAARRSLLEDCSLTPLMISEVIHRFSYINHQSPMESLSRT